METVAVLGASKDRQKYGNRSVRAHLRAGFKVYPVNPNETEIEGQPVYRSLAELPQAVARITVYLPPRETRRMLPEIAAAGAQEVFFNPGSADDAILAEARALGIPAILACSTIDLTSRTSEDGEA